MLDTIDPENPDFWNSDDYREFVAGLSEDRVEALRDLLLIAALVDELLTLEERVEIAHALQELPGLDHTAEFDSAEAIDHIDDLYDRYAEQGDELLEELIERLGDVLNLSHALEAVVVLMATNDNEFGEANFARRLGVLMDVPDTFVEDLLDRYGWD